MTFVKPHLNFELNFVLKSCRKRPLPEATATTFAITQVYFSSVFIKALISDHSEALIYIHCLNQHFNETADCTLKWFIDNDLGVI